MKLVSFPAQIFCCVPLYHIMPFLMMHHLMITCGFHAYHTIILELSEGNPSCMVHTSLMTVTTSNTVYSNSQQTIIQSLCLLLQLFTQLIAWLWPFYNQECSTCSTSTFHVKWGLHPAEKIYNFHISVCRSVRLIA